MNKTLSIFPGFALAFLIYVVAYFSSDYVGKDLLGYAKSPISTVLFSIVIGMLIGNLIKLSNAFSPGITFSLKFILHY